MTDAERDQLVRQGLAELEGVLSRDEWNAVADANNGCFDLLRHAESPVPPLSAAWANVVDSEGLGEKWGVDPAALAGKLRSASPAAGEAIAFAVRRFWQNCDSVDHLRDRWWEFDYRPRGPVTG